jgi:hypothetical protein
MIRSKEFGIRSQPIFYMDKVSSMLTMTPWEFKERHLGNRGHVLDPQRIHIFSFLNL